MPAPIRVVIVDDHPAFRRTARELLELRGHAVVGEADCAAAAYEAIATSQPDVVVLDVGLGAESGFDIARTLSQTHPGLAVLLVSAGEPRDLGLVVGAGARGFAPKCCLPEIDLRAFMLRALAV
jgi:DNA-binding NarL/FixJ family response regulator